MFSRLFAGIPIGYSHDDNSTRERQETHTCEDEHRVSDEMLPNTSNSEEQCRRDSERVHSHGRRKSIFSKIRKFFTTVVVPVLVFIPRAIAAVAGLMTASARLLEARTAAKLASAA